VKCPHCGLECRAVYSSMMRSNAQSAGRSFVRKKVKMTKHRSFKLDKFLKAVDSGLRAEYFTKHGLTFPC